MITRSIARPLIVGIVGILATLAVLVGWNVIFSSYFHLAGEQSLGGPGLFYWLSLSLGDLLLAGVLGILILFLIGTIRQTFDLWRQDTFIDSVTHELRSPLASIRIALETLERRELDPETRRRFIGMMKADVDRLSDFIERVLEAGRLEQGDRPFELTAIDPVGLAESCVERVCRRHKVPREAVRIENRLPTDTPCLVCDPVAFGVILENLLDNAVKYSPEGVEVTVRLRGDEDGVQVEVVDRGIGIPPALLKKVFGRFYRVEGNRRRFRGTGLGLYVSRTLVERLGGRIEAHSAGEGKGALFRFHLPHPRLAPDAGG